MKTACLVYHNRTCELNEIKQFRNIIIMQTHPINLGRHHFEFYKLHLYFDEIAISKTCIPCENNYMAIPSDK